MFFFHFTRTTKEKKDDKVWRKDGRGGKSEERTERKRELTLISFGKQAKAFFWI